MGGILLLLMVLVAGQAFAPSLLLAIVMTGIYTPAGYYLERFLYNRRRASEEKRRLKARAERGR